MRERRKGEGVDRRSVLGGAAALVGGAMAGRAGAGAWPETAEPKEAGSQTSFPFAEMRLSELAAGLEAGRWTSAELVEAYVAEIGRVDGTTNAIAELNPDAASIAADLDLERAAGRVRGPLHGIPVVVKDNLDTGDRMETTAGSLALAGSHAARDAFVVARLREAGAVLLGKTNLSEWANFRSTRSTSGWSGRGGQVRNPYALDRNPCGSSSGSGVAPSANLCAAAVGTETDGSVTCPAAFNGIAGLKPTVGLVSRSGIVPISHTQDTAGPMGRTVEDVAILLGGMAGADPADAATRRSAGHVESDYRRLFGAKALAGARLGVARNFFGWHPEIDRQMEDVLTALKELGAELVDPAEIPHKGEYGEAEWQVLLYEFKTDLEAYLRTRPPGTTPTTLAELIEWNRAHAERSMPWFGQEIFELAVEKGPLTESAYLEALATCAKLSREEGLDKLFADHELDAVVCPSMGPAYPIDWVNGDAYGGSVTEPCAVAGYPHLTVPAGYVLGLPWGLSFLGTAWSEAKLLAYGDAFERATKARREPRLAPTLDLGGV